MLEVFTFMLAVFQICLSAKEHILVDEGQEVGYPVEDAERDVIVRLNGILSLGTQPSITLEHLNQFFNTAA